MAADSFKLKGGGSSTVPSLPPPRPKSPPQYPDLYGKRREMSKVQMLEREIGFLEEELKSVERLQPASKSCKEVTDFVVANSDPLMPTNRKNRKSCRFWRWLCRLPCFNISWICCCCYSGCTFRVKKPRCCTCNCDTCGCCWCTCMRDPCTCCSCSCFHCPKFKWPRCTCTCSCSCSCPSSNCCKKPSCSCNCCKCGFPSCLDCACCECSWRKCDCCKCSWPKCGCWNWLCCCPKLKCSVPKCPKCPNCTNCFEVCLSSNCTKNCCNPCCLSF